MFVFAKLPRCLRSWLDDKMVWDIPRDERPTHVCNPWVWIPDAPVSDVAIQIQTVDEIMDHLRTINRQGALPSVLFCSSKCLFRWLHAV